MKRNTHGFSFLEVLVSAAIIAVLTVIGVVSYSSANRRSRDVKRKGDLEQIRSALEMYRTDYGAYPNPNRDGEFKTASDLSVDLVDLDYMPSIPIDPNSDKSYWYQGIDTLGTGIYNGYCLCAGLETVDDASPQTTCTVPLSTDCDYGLRNP